jgi:hypothetical protein
VKCASLRSPLFYWLASVIRPWHATTGAIPMTLLKLEKVTITLEAIGDGKIRVNSSSWDDVKVILARRGARGPGEGQAHAGLKAALIPARQRRGNLRSGLPDVDASRCLYMRHANPELQRNAVRRHRANKRKGLKCYRCRPDRKGSRFASASNSINCCWRTKARRRANV